MDKIDFLLNPLKQPAETTRILRKYTSITPVAFCTRVRQGIDGHSIVIIAKTISRFFNYATFEDMYIALYAIANKYFRPYQYEHNYHNRCTRGGYIQRVWERAERALLETPKLHEFGTVPVGFDPHVFYIEVGDWSISYEEAPSSDYEKGTYPEVYSSFQSDESPYPTSGDSRQPSSSGYNSSGNGRRVQGDVYGSNPNPTTVVAFQQTFAPPMPPPNTLQKPGFNNPFTDENTRRMAELRKQEEMKSEMPLVKHKRDADPGGWDQGYHETSSVSTPLKNNPFAAPAQGRMIDVGAVRVPEARLIDIDSNPVPEQSRLIDAESAFIAEPDPNVELNSSERKLARDALQAERILNSKPEMREEESKLVEDIAEMHVNAPPFNPFIYFYQNLNHDEIQGVCTEFFDAAMRSSNRYIQSKGIADALNEDISGLTTNTIKAFRGNLYMPFLERIFTILRTRDVANAVAYHMENPLTPVLLRGYILRAMESQLLQKPIVGILGDISSVAEKIDVDPSVFAEDIEPPLIFEEEKLPANDLLDMGSVPVPGYYQCPPSDLLGFDEAKFDVDRDYTNSAPQMLPSPFDWGKESADLNRRIVYLQQELDEKKRSLIECENERVQLENRLKREADVYYRPEYVADLELQLLNLKEELKAYELVSRFPVPDFDPIPEFVSVDAKNLGELSDRLDDVFQADFTNQLEEFGQVVHPVNLQITTNIDYTSINPTMPVVLAPPIRPVMKLAIETVYSQGFDGMIDPTSVMHRALIEHVSRESGRNFQEELKVDFPDLNPEQADNARMLQDVLSDRMLGNEREIEVVAIDDFRPLASDEEKRKAYDLVVETFQQNISPEEKKFEEYGSDFYVAPVRIEIQDEGVQISVDPPNMVIETLQACSELKGAAKRMLNISSSSIFSLEMDRTVIKIATRLANRFSIVVNDPEQWNAKQTARVLEGMESAILTAKGEMERVAGINRLMSDQITGLNTQMSELAMKLKQTENALATADAERVNYIEELEKLREGYSKKLQEVTQQAFSVVEKDLAELEKGNLAEAFRLGAAMEGDMSKISESLALDSTIQQRYREQVSSLGRRLKQEKFNSDKAELSLTTLRREYEISLYNLKNELKAVQEQKNALEVRMDVIQSTALTDNEKISALGRQIEVLTGNATTLQVNLDDANRAITKLDGEKRILENTMALKDNEVARLSREQSSSLSEFENAIHAVQEQAAKYANDLRLIYESAAALLQEADPEFKRSKLDTTISLNSALAALVAKYKRNSKIEDSNRLLQAAKVENETFITQLRTKLLASEATVEDLNKKILEHETTIRKNDETISSLKTRIAILNTQNEKKDFEILEANSKVQMLRDADDRATEAENEIKKLRSEKRDLAEQKSRLQGQLKEAEDEVMRNDAKHQEELNNISLEADTKIKSMQQEVQDYSEKLDAARVEIGQLNQSVIDYKSTIDQYTERELQYKRNEEQLEFQIKTLKDNVNTISATLGVAEQTIQSKVDVNEYNRLNETYKQVTHTKNELELQVTDLNSKILNLERQLTTAGGNESVIKRLESELVSAKSTEFSLRNELSDALDQIRALNGKLRVAGVKNNQIITDLTALTTEYNIDVGGSGDLAGAITNFLNSKISEISRLKAALSTAKLAADNSLELGSMYDTSQKSLSNKVDSLNRIKANLDNEIAGLRETELRLKGDITTLRRSEDSLKGQLDELNNTYKAQGTALAAAQERISKLEKVVTEKENLQNKVTDLEQQLRDSQSKEIVDTETINEKKRALRDLQTEIKKLNERLTAQELGETQRINEVKGVLQGSIDEQLKTITELRESVKKLTNEKHDMQVNKDRSDLQLADLERRVTDLKAERDQLTTNVGDIDAKDARTRALNEKIVANERLVVKLREEGLQKTQRIVVLEAQVYEMENRVLQSHTTVEDLKTKSANLEANLAMLAKQQTVFNEQFDVPMISEDVIPYSQIDEERYNELNRTKDKLLLENDLLRKTIESLHKAYLPEAKKDEENRDVIEKMDQSLMPTNLKLELFEWEGLYSFYDVDLENLTPDMLEGYCQEVLGITYQEFAETIDKGYTLEFSVDAKSINVPISDMTVDTLALLSIGLFDFTSSSLDMRLMTQRRLAVATYEYDRMNLTSADIERIHPITPNRVLPLLRTSVKMTGSLPAQIDMKKEKLPPNIPGLPPQVEQVIEEPIVQKEENKGEFTRLSHEVIISALAREATSEKLPFDLLITALDKLQGRPKEKSTAPQKENLVTFLSLFQFTIEEASQHIQLLNSFIHDTLSGFLPILGTKDAVMIQSETIKVNATLGGDATEAEQCPILQPKVDYSKLKVVSDFFGIPVQPVPLQVDV